MEALQVDGSGRNVLQLFLRNLAAEVLDVPYDFRHAYLNNKYNFEEDLLNEKMIGNTTGQILLNFDEMEPRADDHTEEIEQEAKTWKHLYDADYELLFNQRIFPIDMLRGKLIGEYMIQHYDLFDLNLEPQNICIKDHENGMCESHTIQFCV